MIAKHSVTLGDDSISDPSLQGLGRRKGEGHPCSSCAHHPQGETSHRRRAVTELPDAQGGRRCPATVQTPGRACLMGWCVGEGFGEEVTTEVGLEW